jgi:hypothetical protein
MKESNLLLEEIDIGICRQVRCPETIRRIPDHLKAVLSDGSGGSKDRDVLVCWHGITKSYTKSRGKATNRCRPDIVERCSVICVLDNDIRALV